MTNTILTHQMISRRAAKRFMEAGNLIKNINTGRSEDFTSVNGYKKGDNVDIGIPPVPVVFTGSQFAGGGAAPDATEKKVNLKLDTQKHVALTFTTKEKVLSLDDYDERFIKPAIQSLVSAVQADLLARLTKKVANYVGTAGSIPTSRKVYGQAANELNRFLAPENDRTCLISGDAMVELTDANATLFNPGGSVSEAFKEGMTGRFAGMDFDTNQSLLTLVNGAGTGYLVNGTVSAGATALPVDTGTGALLKGQLFTLPNVYSVHPITGVSTGKLRVFVVTADYAGGAGNVSIYPEITPTTSSVIGTVNAAPADNAALTLVGSASTGYRQGLAFQKDAFAAAFAPLPVLVGCEGYTASMNGISVRVMTGGDFTNDQESTRIDVLYGEAAPRPNHACRVTE